MFYGGTNRLFSKIIERKKNIEFTFHDLNTELLENIIKENTKMLWIESPTNPTLTIVDIQKLSKIAHQYQIIVVVDNTFATPFFQNPLDLGGDIVMHSVTKYINGHSDVIQGAIITNNQVYAEDIKFYQYAIGAVPSPFDCYLAIRGIKTLHLRMERHASNAIKIAKFLENHSKVIKISYPGLESHPQHQIAKKQMSGFSGMITFWLDGGLQESKKFLENFRNIYISRKFRWC